MMGRLWPIMRERPEEFRLNPASPLYQGLQVFVQLSATPVNLVPALPSGWWQLGTTPGGPSNIYFDPILRRFAYRGDNSNYANASRIRLPHTSNLDANSGFTAFVWAWWENTSATSWLFDIGDGYPNFQVLLDSYIGNMEFVIDGQKVLESIPAANRWFAYAGRFETSTNGMQLWRDGILVSYDTRSSGNVQPTAGVHIYAIESPMRATDAMYWTRCLSEGEIKAISDPSNVDYRLGRSGPPLILPPRRRLWPVSFAETPTGKVPWHLFQMVVN